MSSFSKVIQPTPAHFFNTPKPIHICSFNSLDDNETIGAAIPMPGMFDTKFKCCDTRNFKLGFDMYIKDLHLRNASLIQLTPSNY